MSGFVSGAVKRAQELEVEREKSTVVVERSRGIAEFLQGECLELSLDGLCEVVGVDSSRVRPGVSLSGEDVALAVWVKYGSGSYGSALQDSRLSEDEFMVLYGNLRQLGSLAGV